ncbi:MAG: TolC family protein [Acidobacteriota bacterium]
MGWRRGLLSAAVLGLVGCASVAPHALNAPAPVPESPARPAVIDTRPAAAAAAPVAIPDALLRPGAAFSLGQIVDLALATSPQTRAAWLQARAARALLGSKRAPYYPSLDLTANLSRAKQSAVGGQSEFEQSTYGPAVALSYLLLDFGGRAGNAEEALAGLLAADFNHDAAVQNLVLAVEQAYFGYMNAKAQLGAARETVTQTQTGLDAARVRHQAGVATIADVLQAQTAFSQARLTLETIEGQVMVVRGALATAMGLPASIPLDVGALPTEVPVIQVEQAVEGLIEEARLRRPDLLSLRALAEKALRHAGAIRSEGLPTLSLSANANRTYYSPSETAGFADNWSTAVVLRYPLFSGFARSFDLEKARQDAAVAQEQAASYEQQVILQVWTSYYALLTATRRLETVKDLLASAEQSHAVALGRYKEGVGTILDLLAAQSALASARAQEIQARADWFVTVARLAHDTGAASPLLATQIVTEEKVER